MTICNRLFLLFCGVLLAAGTGPALAQTLKIATIAPESSSNTEETSLRVNPVRSAIWPMIWDLVRAFGAALVIVGIV